MKIEVGVTGVGAYVGRITGADETYGFALEFLPKTQISRAYAKVEIAGAGQYRVSDGAVIASRRIDTGFIRVSWDGTVTEIQRGEVIL